MLLPFFARYRRSPGAARPRSAAAATAATTAAVARLAAAGGSALLTAVLLISAFSFSLFLSDRGLTVYADTTAQTLPFAQNWSNVSLITADDNWSNVPGIIGYRGDDLTGATGTGADPQVIVAENTQVVDVNANQTAPNTFITGGVAEFEITNPVVALQGSGTADAPNLVITLNTTGQSGVSVAYNLRDIDGSADNSVQPVALQFRVGTSGNFTNLPSAFVADATTGPNLATLVTPVNIVLPAACDNQAVVQLRILTTNAVGSDEWVGVDDLQIGTGGTVALSGTGSAAPNLVNAGATTLLTVAVTPATNPASTGIAVTGDLSSIGGGAAQQFFDDGTNGDQVASDNIFSFLAAVPANAASGARTLAVSIADAQSRTATALIALAVRVPASPAEHLVMGNPSGAVQDENQPLNYLLPKNQYVVGYNRDLGRPNWVSWHLDSTWLGTAPRQDDFRPDPALPAAWYHVLETDYQGSGFDRGHHTPSGDRTVTVPDNSATFLMTNMMPQAPDNNQGPWEQLESYCRTLVNQGNELYIIAGGVGEGGTGSNGPATRIASGNVSVPAQTWKVIIVLPAGENDVARVTTATRTIAVVMPNVQGIRNNNWEQYQRSVNAVENLTGYDFLANIPDQIENVIEARNPAGTINRTAFDFDADGKADLSVFRGTGGGGSGNGEWYVAQSSNNQVTGVQFGLGSDRLAPADYDGDGRTDLAVWREAAFATFYVLQSATNTIRSEQFGTAGDVPQSADWDGDGRADLAVYRNATGGTGGGGEQSYFFYRPSAQTGVDFIPVAWGTSGDKPVRGDYDGDGKTDAAVFRSSDGVWYVLQSSDSQLRAEAWGAGGSDRLVPADYDGDGRTDLAIYRDGLWAIRESANNQARYQSFGVSTDIPAAADYDGDGLTDLGVFRSGNWYLLRSTGGFASSEFGLGTDTPVPAAFNR